MPDDQRIHQHCRRSRGVPDADRNAGARGRGGAGLRHSILPAREVQALSTNNEWRLVRRLSRLSRRDVRYAAGGRRTLSAVFGDGFRHWASVRLSRFDRRRDCDACKRGTHRHHRAHTDTRRGAHARPSRRLLPGFGRGERCSTQPLMIRSPGSNAYEDIPMTSRHPSRARRGFALPVSILAIVLVSAMVAGGYMSGIQDYRMGRNSLVQQRALAAAEFGLDSAYAAWSKTWNSVATGNTRVLVYSASDGSWIDTVRVTKLNRLSFLVVSEGRAGGQGGQLSARRRAAMLVRLNMAAYNQPGAIVSRGTSSIGGNTNLYATDPPL